MLHKSQNLINWKHNKVTLFRLTKFKDILGSLGIQTGAKKQLFI